MNYNPTILNNNTNFTIRALRSANSVTTTSNCIVAVNTQKKKTCDLVTSVVLGLSLIFATSSVNFSTYRQIFFSASATVVGNLQNIR